MKYYGVFRGPLAWGVSFLRSILMQENVSLCLTYRRINYSDFVYLGYMATVDGAEYYALDRVYKCLTAMRNNCSLKTELEVY